MTDIPETVVLVADDGTPVGTAPKAAVHSTETPLHLAFSCHVFDDRGRVLVTRRALAKKTWPGVWTNAFCGHPAPEEPMEDALVRRAERELGLTLTDVRVSLPDFRYRAVDASGVVENEICPVFTARAVGEPSPTRSRSGRGSSPSSCAPPSPRRPSPSARGWAGSSRRGRGPTRRPPEPRREHPDPFLTGSASRSWRRAPRLPVRAECAG